MTTQDRASIPAEELNALKAKLDNCNYAQLKEVRAAVDSRAEKMKADFMVQAGEMGLACSDDNGNPKRKRPNARKEAD